MEFSTLYALFSTWFSTLTAHFDTEYSTPHPSLQTILGPWLSVTVWSRCDLLTPSLTFCDVPSPCLTLCDISVLVWPCVTLSVILWPWGNLVTSCLALCDVFSPVWPCVIFSVPIWPCVTSSLLIWPCKTLSDPEVTSSLFVWPCATFSVPIWPCVTCHFWADRVWPCQFLSDLVWPRHFWSDLVWPFQSLSDLVWPPQSLLDLLWPCRFVTLCDLVTPCLTLCDLLSHCLILCDLFSTSLTLWAVVRSFGGPSSKRRSSTLQPVFLSTTVTCPGAGRPSRLHIRQVSIKFRITARQPIVGRLDTSSPPANRRPAAQDSGAWRHITAERIVVCLVATRGTDTVRFFGYQKFCDFYIVIVACEVYSLKRNRVW